MPLADLPSNVAHGLVLAWLTLLGAVIGSFLNVVVYRLPAGKSLVHPGSHCPKCGHPIRWYDNLPVLGWAILGGRCRDCRADIAARYPLVEAASAAMFFLVGWFELTAGARNLPVRAVVLPDAVLHPARSADLVAGMAALHLLVLSTLLAAALIEHDRVRIPPRLWWPALLTAALAPLVWPELRPLPAWPALAREWAGPADGVAGLLAGAGWGLLVEATEHWIRSRASSPVQPKKRKPRQDPIADMGRLAGWAAVGLALGWQAALGIGSAAVLLGLLLRRTGPRWMGALTVATLLGILFWARLLG